MPSRYTGGEINSITKDHDEVDLTFALVFPDLYEIGTSHFGVQILYSILNRHHGIAAERFFTPAPDMAQHQKSLEIPCLSMESRTPLGEFDIIGVSLLYELNFTNILTMFDLSKIPFFAEQRPDDFPLVIGGGPCAFNPEPLADFFDAFVIGDGEAAVVELSEIVMQFKKEGDGKKDTLLKMLSGIQGVYVPSFFTPGANPAGGQDWIPLEENQARIRRAILPDLETAFFPTAPVIPFGKPVHDRLRLEIARGCSRGCRFCQAGMIYRPVRERKVESLVKMAQESLDNTGYKDISLLSLSTGDYSGLEPLINALLGLNPVHCNAISLPSIRAEKLTPSLMELIRSVRKTGFTIAPEAGSQRLRDIINKNLTQSSIEATVENALNLGWKQIKLYFMMGLPFETSFDIEAICSLSKHLASTRAKGRNKITVSIAPFIPKPHTPFQRCAQITPAKSMEYLQYMKDNLRHPRVNLKWQNPYMSVIEGVWSRGDRKLSALLISAYNNGCRLDGWSDHFQFDLWQEAFSETGIDPADYTSRPRKDTEPLPWDHIDAGISAGFLESEFKKASLQALTPDCRDAECAGCGICDFTTIQPRLYASDPGRLEPRKNLPSAQQPEYIKYEIVFSKTGDARFFGHLELANIISRAVERSPLQVKYTSGFNSAMKLSFDNPLPLGMESEAESFFLHVKKGTRPPDIIKALNTRLPGGLKIQTAFIFSKSRQNTLAADTYHVRFSQPAPDKSVVDTFLNASEWILEDISSKGKKRRVDLRQVVEKIGFPDRQTMEIVIKKTDQRTVRPSDILSKALCLPEHVIRTAVIKKKKLDR